MRELIRISAAFSHTRHLKVFSSICDFAAENKGEILAKVDSSKIALLTKNRFGKEYRPSMIEDYLLTAEELNLIHHTSKIAYGLTDYGLFVTTSVSKDRLMSVPLTGSERYIYLQLLVKNDFDYVLSLLRCLEETDKSYDIIRSVISRSRCSGLKKLGEAFQRELTKTISDFNLGLEGRELTIKIEKMKERTLNHRLSSLLFWLTEIATGYSLLKPAPHLLKTDDLSDYFGIFSRLERSLGGLDPDENLESIMDERFPLFFSDVFGINARLPRKEDSSVIASGIIAMLNSKWKKFVRLQPYPFQQRIPALPFLLFIQCYFLLKKNLQLSFTDLMDVFRKQIQDSGYILTWRYDFHSGYIEKVS